jgi:hypothetical protein
MRRYDGDNEVVERVRDVVKGEMKVEICWTERKGSRGMRD